MRAIGRPRRTLEPSTAAPNFAYSKLGCYGSSVIEETPTTMKQSSCAERFNHDEHSRTAIVEVRDMIAPGRSLVPIQIDRTGALASA